MKIIVVSDSHGNYSLLERVYLSNQDADIFLHLGDYELPEYMLHSYTFIKGNCDYLSDAPLSRDIDYDFGRVRMEHGDSINFRNFEEYVKSKDCKIFLFGHTHQKYAKKIGNTYVFNPGSLTRPRDNELGSYLILRIDKNNNINYEFKLLDL